MPNNLPPNGNLFKKIRFEWRRLDLTNKVLLLVGIVLLFELIFSIFLHTFSADASTDAFFRITFASVMGYFLGGMNLNSNKTTLPEDEHAVENNVTDSNDENFQNVPHIRTLFITLVCLACIITLSIATFTNQTSYSEGLIQLRNIISTSIGFLISKATYRG